MNHMDVRQAVVDACTFQQTTFMANHGVTKEPKQKTWSRVWHAEFH